MGRLTFSLDHDGDGTGQLTCRADAQLFAGVGAAWFALDELADFCGRMEAYPLDLNRLPTLAGGYLNEDGRLTETLLSLRIAPYGGSGTLEVNVQLAEAPDPDSPPERRCRVSTWLLVSYNDVESFRASFLKLLSGEADESVLASGPT